MLSKTELKELTKEEVITKLRDDEDALMNLRFQHALQQLENPVRLRYLKREVAQLKTLLQEFECGLRK
ncbi:MAG: 50S ribosomal protein L29 [Candidatus Marinimicrobia bacterium]|jgi:large subunit ribosomal protein L29|nr:50S ribosomal protein L29 [Candidatus Neomarinimicrobiota bacterium]MDD4960686.1 50S ribosomal protein L29 [Candidatus Neomarinimicrobiota bacterium]MDD5709195.1 50S ribosomal protein L29 [Candidatus Neomarinimicrobiota bacterium]MDX9777936.1 50S ribosomal protein L29 [bacterium]